MSRSRSRSRIAQNSFEEDNERRRGGGHINEFETCSRSGEAAVRGASFFSACTGTIKTAQLAARSCCTSSVGGRWMLALARSYRLTAPCTRHRHRDTGFRKPTVPTVRRRQCFMPIVTRMRQSYPKTTSRSHQEPAQGASPCARPSSSATQDGGLNSH